MAQSKMALKHSKVAISGPEPALKADLHHVPEKHCFDADYFRFCNSPDRFGQSPPPFLAIPAP